MYTDENTGVKTTTLQVVKNFAWTFPYFACAMIALGMVFHFLIRLTTFLRNQRKLAATPVLRPIVKTPKPEPTAPAGVWQKFARFFPFAIVVLAALMLMGKLMTPSVRDDRPNLYGFGQIPVQHGGRIQPLDSLARNTFMVISGKQEFVDPSNDKTYSAIEWLLMLWATPDKTDDFRVFRIEHDQVLSLMEVKPRPGAYRYSWNELKGQVQMLGLRASEANKKDKDKRTLVDEKTMELARHIELYREIRLRSSPGFIPADDAQGKWMSYADVVETAGPRFFREAEQKARKELLAEWEKDPGLLGQLAQQHLKGFTWEEAKREFGGEEKAVQFIIDEEIKDRVRPVARDNFLKSLPGTFPPAAGMEKILEAYRGNNPAAFNAAVAEYHEKHTAAISDSDKSKARLEARMNHFDPFLQCEVLYIGVVIFAALSWLFWHQPLRRAAFGLACVTLAVHTAALVARMYIGNRPPVTNLYSSAVFIGWGGLVLCLVLEWIYKLGIGSFAGGLLGFATMYIARFLAESGDTLEMLQAVLDTNFWLSTHVVCVTLGYMATLVAGLIGIVYIISGVFTPAMKGVVGKMVGSMLYGTICFAMLLSFTGTVLGGIWADQSWGRFWGWDPKENGAVLIVIWNALILHARWGGIIKPRGMAVLAVIGNMWTFWSWFGTNQLGIGLHAYGFDNRLVLLCDVVWVWMALIAVLGMIPLKYWASSAPIAPAKA
jgi:ABC-type transport system involved in cytochrome c biogenesis permease subunit